MEGFPQPASSGEKKKSLNELVLERAKLQQKIDDMSARMAKLNEGIDDIVSPGSSNPSAVREAGTGMTLNDFSRERAKLELELEKINNSIKLENSSDYDMA